MLTVERGAQILEVHPEFLRRRIRSGKLNARFDKGSPKLGYIFETVEFIRYLRSIGEDDRADLLEREEGLQAS